MAPTANSTPAPAARCILLVGSRGAVPSNLVAALNQRGLKAAIVRQAPEVMTQLAAGGASSVVVVEPELQARISELHAAAGVYHPEVRFWSYTPQQPGREARLAAFRPAAAPSGDGAQTPTRETDLPDVDPKSARPAPASGYASAGVSESDAEGRGPRPESVQESRERFSALVTRAEPVEEGSTGPLVTETELAMLLGGDSTPPASPAGRDEKKTAGKP